MTDIHEPLSERETEILCLVATGAANKEIARQLSISPNTVKVHLRNIFTKIGVASRTEATLYAVRLGLVQPNAAETAAEEQAGQEELADSEVLPPEADSPDFETDADYSPGLPTITIEGNSAEIKHPASQGAAAQRRGLKAWQVGLVLLAALLLIGAGVVGSRYLGMAAPTPQVVLPAQATEAPAGPRWDKKSPLPSSRKGMGMVEYENKFYMLAGETNQGVDGAVFQYDPEKNSWEPRAAKPTAVSDVQAVLLGEKIYVPGGRLKNGSQSNRLEVYDPRQNAWESKASLPTTLSAYALTSYEGSLYLFGGKSGDQYSRAVYRYDPKEDRWEQRAPLSSARAFASAVALSGKIYLLGGYDGKQALDLVDAYFPNRDGDGANDTAWESQPAMPQGRYGMAAVQIANLVYLVGGFDSSHQLASPAGMQYLPQSNDWLPMDTPPLPIGSSAALIASGSNLYIFGGETPSGLSANSLSYQAIYTINVPALQKDTQP